MSWKNLSPHLVAVNKTSKVQIYSRPPILVKLALQKDFTEDEIQQWEASIGGLQWSNQSILTNNAIMHAVNKNDVDEVEDN